MKNRLIAVDILVFFLAIQAVILWITLWTKPAAAACTSNCGAPLSSASFGQVRSWKNLSCLAAACLGGR
jgi:hypothetical protein